MSLVKEMEDFYVKNELDVPKVVGGEGIITLNLSKNTVKNNVSLLLIENVINNFKKGTELSWEIKHICGKEYVLVHNKQKTIKIYLGGID